MSSFNEWINKNKRILWCAILLAGAKAWCAAPENADSLTCIINFRISKTTIDSQYMGNSDAIAAFRTALDSVGSEHIKRIAIRSWASPEGNTTFNNWLSTERASAARKLVDQLLPSGERGFKVDAEGESWDGLKSFVASDEKLDAKMKERIMTILNGTQTKDQKKLELRRMPCYGYLKTTYYTRLRNSIICVFYTQKMPEPITVLPDSVTTVEPAEVDTVIIKEITETTYPPEVKKQKDGIVLAVKTNLLYDALCVPNAGVELPLGDDWSVSAAWMYAWWKSDKRHNYWRTYGGDIEMRRWFGKPGRRVLTGHHVGVYGQIVTYDFERGGRGYLGDKWSYAAGLSYGYSMPIAKRLNIDFSVGVGYLGGVYKEYLPMEECYVWQCTKNRHYIGPTKAEVSLVWLLGRGYNVRKGDKR